MKPLYTLLLLIITWNLQAQLVEGIVLSNEGLPVEFALMSVNGSETHVHSDPSGSFQIKDIKVNDSLVFQHFLFEEKTIILTENHINNGLKCVMKEKAFLLNQVTITPNTNTLKTLSAFDYKMNPVQNSQELLRLVPGLFIGQHAGGGKAEQIFMRGFDIDHGTDVNISIDGLPINVVSHGHGQGYADMHFILPEIISSLEYGKGPYAIDKGNFATAGFVQINTLDNVKNSLFSLDYGSFNTLRIANVFKLLDTPNQSAYLASEYLQSDGPFESSQGFIRRNMFGKYSKTLDNNDHFSVWASHFSSRWNASGQIPNRSVVDGSISRFGAIDDTEGGQTSRSNIYFKYNKYISSSQFIKTYAFVSTYDFELFSNFTFFLNDPMNGDQIKQKDARSIYGLNTEWNYIQPTIVGDLTYRVGAGFRYDDANDIELSNTANRKITLQNLALGNIDETNIYTYGDIHWDKGNFMLNIESRLDLFNMSYENILSEKYDYKQDRAFSFNPKLNVQYTPNQKTQLFLKLGKGFHSNDTRVVINDEARQILPAAYGADLGIVQKISKNLFVTGTLWYLFLDQEFVYVGDAAIVELSGQTRRTGIDIGARYQPNAALFMFVDVNIAKGRSIADEKGQDLIALAPGLTSTGGLQYNFKKWISGSLKYRHLADRSANNDNSIIASGYTIVDGNINLMLKKFTFGIEVNNLLNAKWNETQFATESRLQNESEPVEEIHFTPGAPFGVKGKVIFSF
ncbi:MAG: TonB-dependent receptor plug domain-containing protein [Saprospiraceae bacterium]